jgi:hypothetical protein
MDYCFLYEDFTISECRCLSARLVDALLCNRIVLRDRGDIHLCVLYGDLMNSELNRAAKKQ